MKVLIVGDSPFLATGFARVNSKAAAAFAEAGFEVGIVSGLSMDPVADSLGYTMFYPELGDVMGMLATPAAIESFNPDLIYHTGEPGMLTAFTQVIPARIPLLSYVPIEGEPIINQNWQTALRVTNVMTCSQYGADILTRDCGIQNPVWVYHGVDHDKFRVNGRREEVRSMLGWTDKFVLMHVGANVRRKQHPRLFEALAILKYTYKQDDIILYDHTIPFDGYWLEGWNLPEVSTAMKVHKEVVFNPAILQHGDSIPDVGLFDGLGLVDLYNAADLFVLPSQVEGFGLPIAEAMACGLPVLVTKYAAGWEVARPAGAGIPVNDWEIHKSGTRYANVDTSALAKEILRLKRNPRERLSRSALGLQRVRDFRWEDFTEKLIATAQDILSKASSEGTKASNDQGRPQDSREDKGQGQGDSTNPTNKIEAASGTTEAKARSDKASKRIGERTGERSQQASSAT